MTPAQHTPDPRHQDPPEPHHRHRLHAPKVVREAFYVTSLRQARRLIIFVVGVTVVLGGIALLVLPGPAFLVIPTGLAILATEFVWARHLLKRFRDQAGQAFTSTRSFWRRGFRRTPPE